MCICISDADDEDSDDKDDDTDDEDDDEDYNAVADAAITAAVQIVYRRAIAISLLLNRTSTYQCTPKTHVYTCNASQR